MSADWDMARLAGIKVAQEGGSLDDCPHKKDERLHMPWRSGFRLVKPDGMTSIGDVFTPAFGGPLRRKSITEPVTDQGYSRSTGRYEMPVGDWVRLENYLVGGDSGGWNKVFQSHLVHDGIYDVTDMPLFYVEDAETLDSPITDEGLEFVQEHGAGNIYIAYGYQVCGIFLLAGKPRLFDKGKVLGSFGNGASAVFIDCPSAILIIAEDD